MGAILVAQTVKDLPAVQETQFPLLGQEDPLEKGMATHSSVLVRRIPWTEEPGALQSMELQESDPTEWLKHRYTQRFRWGHEGGALHLGLAPF